MNSAALKIKRAERHFSEILSLFRKDKPFGCFLERNYTTGESAVFAKRNENVANEVAVIIGDILHNLRSAIDHAYWDCTEMYAKSDGEKNKIQFPITSTEDALKKSVLTGLPSRVSVDFCRALESLRPYREGGDRLLCAIHDLDVLDKHKLLIPVGNFTKISSSMLQKQLPDFPSGLINCGFGNNQRDVVWSIQKTNRDQRRKVKIPASGLVVKELNVPVDIVLNEIDGSKPALDVLQELISLTKTVVNTLYVAAGIDVK